MKRSLLIAGLGVFAACLAGWVAIASAQPLPSTLPGPDNPPTPETVKKTESAPTALPTPLPAPGGERESAPAPGTAPTAGPATIPPAPSTLEEMHARPRTTPTSAAPTVLTPAAPTGDEASRPFSPTQEKTDVAVTAENPSGKQEPAVSLEWVGTPLAKVGMAADYSLVVRNICNIPVQQVTVRVRIPAGLTVQSSEPKAGNDAGGILIWELGTLVAKQERVMQLKLQADSKGDVTPQAWVSFTGSSVMRIRIREPKLALKCSMGDKILIGDPAAITLTVSNPGDGSADHVKIKAILSEGLEHARGNKIDFDIGNLAPGESRNVTLLCATRAGGMQKCEATAEAEGGMTAKDSASLNVITPRLDLQLVGPRLRYLERKAIYTLKVTNPGDAPATNVTVANLVPAGFKVLAASDGGRHDFQTRTVSWFLGEIGPGQTREVKLEVQAINPGDHKHKATAVGARGLRAENELMTRVEGLAALLVEMVDVEDPIEVGGDTAYQVRITNTGSKTETDIKLIATVPDKMQFKNAQGPVHYREEGKTIVFETIDKLAPRAEAIFRINVKAMEQGTVRFKIQVTSTNLTDPVVKMEATRIYSDAPEPATGTTPAPTPSPMPVPAPATGPAPAPTTGPAPAPAPTTPTPPPALPGGLPGLPGGSD